MRCIWQPANTNNTITMISPSTNAIIAPLTAGTVHSLWFSNAMSCSSLVTCSNGWCSVTLELLVGVWKGTFAVGWAALVIATDDDWGALSDFAPTEVGYFGMAISGFGVELPEIIEYWQTCLWHKLHQNCLSLTTVKIKIMKIMLSEIVNLIQQCFIRH